MAEDDVLFLVTTSYQKDKYGVPRKSVKKRRILCRKKSISRSEFFQGGRSGFNPEFEFDVFHGDYNGESLCEYEGKTYSIYRTYRVPGSDDLELYVRREGGTNGASQSNV